MITCNHSEHNWIFIVEGKGEHIYPKATWSEAEALENLYNHLDSLAR